MAAGVEQMILEAVKSGRAILGAERTLKELKKGNVEKVVVAINYPEEEKERIKYYAELAGVELVVYEEDNKELGALCQKPFPVSVLGIKKK